MSHTLHDDDDHHHGGGMGTFLSSYLIYSLNALSNMIKKICINNKVILTLVKGLFVCIIILFQLYVMYIIKSPINAYGLNSTKTAIGEDKFTDYYNRISNNNDVIISGGNLCNNMSGRPTYIEYISPSMIMSNDNINIWSRIQCIGWHRNRSCAFDNIYYDKTNDEFYIILPLNPILRGNIIRAPYNGYALNYNDNNINHDNTGIPVTEDSIKDLIKGCSRGPKGRRQFHPNVVFLNISPSTTTTTTMTNISSSLLKEWEYSMLSNNSSEGGIGLSYVDGISAYFGTLWAHNVGHFMYDNLYPIWVTIIRFGYLNESVNILGYESTDANNDTIKDWQHWELLKVFGHTNKSGLTTTQLDSSLNKFQRLLVGSRWMGHRDQQRHMGMPGSYSYENALYWYGQRILAGYNIIDWDKALNPNTPIIVDNNKCKGVITDNKRYSKEEREMLKSLADNSIDLFNCDIIYMNWKDYTFKQQIELFSNMNIYISAVGTGMTRCHLIKPGGVIVHLGEMVEIGTPARYQVAYRDVHMAIGSPHLNSVYYSRKLWNIFGRLIREGVIDVINKGINLLNNGYPIPRPYNNGLSPTSLTYERYCSNSSDDCNALTEVRNGVSPITGSWASTSYCEYCSWVDYFTTSPLWNGVGCIDNNNNIIHCPLNHKRWNNIVNNMNDDNNDDIAFEPECYKKEIKRMNDIYNNIVNNNSRRIMMMLRKMGDYNSLNISYNNNDILDILLSTQPPNCPFIPPIEHQQCAC